jgi:hypothetical protein
VPVCRAGVEMPRPHELPKELRDLCQRDAVPVDPFQDFEAHLTRLLSDLETMRRQKEELQAARGELIPLLRRLALQRGRAETRHTAAAREAERAARSQGSCLFGGPCTGISSPATSW